MRYVCKFQADAVQVGDTVNIVRGNRWKALYYMRRHQTPGATTNNIDINDRVKTRLNLSIPTVTLLGGPPPAPPEPVSEPVSEPVITEGEPE